MKPWPPSCQLQQKTSTSGKRLEPQHVACAMAGSPYSVQPGWFSETMETFFIGGGLGPSSRPGTLLSMQLDFKAGIGGELATLPIYTHLSIRRSTRSCILSSCSGKATGLGSESICLDDTELNIHFLL